MAESDRQPITLLAGWLVGLQQRWRGKPSALGQAEEEMFTLYFALPIVGIALGVPVTQLDGVAFNVGFVMLTAVLSYIVGASTPLQLVLWKRLSLAARTSTWRVLVPMGTAIAGACIGGVAVVGT